ncbi:MAG: DUF5711 family protein [Candidatus Howiella sp.]|jgi:hypothetical protein
MPEYKKKKGIKVSRSRKTGGKSVPPAMVRPGEPEDSTRKRAIAVQALPIETADARRAKKLAREREKEEQRRRDEEMAARRRSDRADALREKENMSSASAKEVRKPSPEPIPSEVERELLREAGRLPEKERQSHMSEKEQRKSRPPVKRYAPRRPAKFVDPQGNTTFAVVEGRKLLKMRQRWILLGFGGLLALLLLLAAISTPTGVVEYFQNAFAKTGSGSGFPLLASEEGTAGLRAENGVLLLVGGSENECYNASGKQIFVRRHGFSNPAVAQSESRLVVFDRGGTGYSVENMDRVLYSGTMSGNIYNAAMGRSGVSAFVLSSVEYSGELQVYNKKMENIFNWYSADATLTAVGVADNGRRIAAGGVTVSGGAYRSTVYLFDTKQSAPLSSLTIEGGAIISIEPVGGSAFLVVCDDRVLLLDRNGTQKAAVAATGTLHLVRKTDDRIAVVDKLAGNSGDYCVSVLDKKGNSLGVFTVRMNIKDVCVAGDSVALLTDSKVWFYTFSGNAAGSVDCDFSVNGVGYTGGKLYLSGLREIEMIEPVSASERRAADSVKT